MTYKTFGKFQNLMLLSRDKATALYRTTDPDSQQAVMLKVFHLPLVTHPDFVGRFQEIMSHVVKLEHQQIIRTMSYGIEDETPYIVMQHAEKGTLQARLNQYQDNNFPLNEIVSYLTKIATGLDYAHQQGFVHQDIQPSNIYISENDEPLIAGFGIADLLTEFSGMTLSDGIFGSPLYLSPEQIAGQTLDGRCDIYALGIIGYQMIQGKPPFEGDMVSVFMQHINNPPPALESRSDVVAVISKALEKQPSDRYADAQAMVDALMTNIAVTPVRISATEVRRALQRQNISTQSALPGNASHTPSSKNSDAQSQRVRIVAGVALIVLFIIIAVLVRGLVF